MTGSRWRRILLQLLTVMFLTGSGLGILNTPRLCDYCSCHYLTTLCDCKNNQQIIIVKDLPNYTENLTVINCINVTVTQNALIKLKSLTYVKFANIKNLHLDKHSLNWTGSKEFMNLEYPVLKINIERSRIHEIPTYAVQGTIEEFRLNQVEIIRIKPFAFSNLIGTLRWFEIKSSTIRNVEGQAFKKFQAENFKIIDTRIDYLPSRSFLDIEVYKAFIIKNCSFNVVKPGAFIIKKPFQTQITNSYFAHLDGDSFNISATGDVEIKNNVFENLYDPAFDIGAAEKEHQRMVTPKLTFDNNTLTTLKVNPLKFKRNNFQTKFGPVYLNETCTCLDIDLWIKNGDWTEHVHCRLNRGYSRAKTFKSDKCDTSSSTSAIVISVVAFVLLCAVLAAVAFLVYRKYKVRRKKPNVTNGKGENGMLGLIVPDGRTYRETELHVIVEKAELLTTEL